jgi:hypothetical protein
MYLVSLKDYIYVVDLTFKKHLFRSIPHILDPTQKNPDSGYDFQRH